MRDIYALVEKDDPHHTPILLIEHFVEFGFDEAPLLIRVQNPHVSIEVVRESSQIH